MSRGGNALIWDYWTKIDGDKIAECNICQKNISYKTTITNLKQHLKIKHIKVFNEFLSKQSFLPNNSLNSITGKRSMEVGKLKLVAKSTLYQRGQRSVTVLPRHLGNLTGMGMDPEDFAIDVNDENESVTSPVDDQTASCEDASAGPSVEQPETVFINIHSITSEAMKQDLPAEVDGLGEGYRILFNPEKADHAGDDAETFPANVNRPQTNQINTQPNITIGMPDSLTKANVAFKQKQTEMLQVEHDYTVEIAKLKIKKLELEITLLENQVKSISKE